VKVRGDEIVHCRMVGMFIQGSLQETNETTTRASENQRKEGRKCDTVKPGGVSCCLKRKQRNRRARRGGTGPGKEQLYRIAILLRKKDQGRRENPKCSVSPNSGKKKITREAGLRELGRGGSRGQEVSVGLKTTSQK